jgi:hypothetical protein
MPEVFSLQAPENNNDNYDRRQSPSFVNTDRQTPMPYENGHERKTEMYFIDTQNEHEPIHNQSPFMSSSSPINHIDHPSGNGPELYHLQVGDNDNNIHDRRSSPPIVSNNRLSPALYQNSNEEGPELYHLRTTDENGRQSPYTIENHQKVHFSNDITHHDNHDQGKVTMYLLTTSDGDNRENLPPQRTPSPPVS